uniref:NADH dehydrogenase subunit 6 n=1 Tax=Flavicorniculum planiforceps TaxID=3112271 RepID=UPI0030036B27|nr:NADH dehydrogenase subunit 6 [Flavicorniculum planiforceps]
MMQWILMTLMFIINLMFMKMKHPLAMGLTLLIQTTLMCMSTGLLTKSFWFSYIMFLIFMGGLLVLFIYVTSLASNEMFSFSIKLMLTLMMTFILLTLLMFFMNKMWFLQNNNNEMQLMNKFNYYIMENSLSLNKLYNYPINIMTIMLMNYLLITLIAVVKITNLFKGPLRPMFN